VPIYRLGDQVPQIHETAYVHPDAVVIGAVRIGPDTSVWPCAVLRGDYGTITIGARTSVQDGVVIHATASDDTFIGDSCVIGHLAHLEGCVVEDTCLIGSNSVVLARVRVGREATVAANAVVLEGTDIPPRALAAGVPAVVREGKSNPDFARGAGEGYAANARRYRAELQRIG
jgi:carbonic anhydrase/acetyltransferase-like protein (isoleucine patch superfamily)